MRTNLTVVICVVSLALTSTNAAAWFSEVHVQACVVEHTSFHGADFPATAGKPLLPFKPILPRSGHQTAAGGDFEHVCLQPKMSRTKEKQIQFRVWLRS